MRNSFKMEDSLLLKLNQQGFIPGPGETEELFFERVRASQAQCSPERQIPRAHWDWARARVKQLFDFEPSFLPVFYSNRSLSLWEGAATWIDDSGLVSIQLREALRKGFYLWYQREEILAHEAVHAARSAFNEGVSEEFFAFLTAEKWWRRLFGPIIQKPWEVWPFVAGALLAIFFPALQFLTGCWLMLGCLRLIHTHKKMRKASRQLLRLLKDKRTTLAVLLRLTEAEISFFAKGGNILSFAQQQKCLRWRLIRLAYIQPLA